MPELLKNYLAGRWIEGSEPRAALTNPVTGATLARASANSLDLRSGYQFARETGGAALRAMTYVQRAAMLGRVVEVLKARRDRYLDISIDNSGTTKNDSGVDVDGAIFTLGYYAKLGAALGEARYLLDGVSAPLDRAGAFQSRHVLTPARGMVLCINAFNFPAWGLWEKAGPALLSGVPVVAKPASSTCWLTHEMVKDVVEAGVLPAGSLSLVCGSGEGLLDALEPFDMVSFTGSALTAATLRTHPAVTLRSIRMNVEADSLNSMLLDPAIAPGSAHFAQFAKDVVKEVTIKSGQRCTAPRRIFIARSQAGPAREALAAAFAGLKVGNPRAEGVQMGSLVNMAQKKTILEDLATLGTEADIVFDGSKVKFVNADETSACVAPTLLSARDSARAARLHEVEVFGPVTVLMPYNDVAEATALIRRGGGSLVSSVYAEDPARAVSIAVDLADSHGRIHVVTPAVATGHTGHGTVMPASIHGGPGRAGGGEELGGLRALSFYHRRCAIQAEAAAVATLDTGGKAS